MCHSVNSATMGSFQSFVVSNLRRNHFSRNLLLNTPIPWTDGSKPDCGIDFCQQHESVTDGTADEHDAISCNLDLEPEWNNLELEIFWHVMKAYIDELFDGAFYLPEPDIVLKRLKRTSARDFEACLFHVQYLIWSGRYSMAVSDFLATKSYFKSSATFRFSDILKRGDMEAIRLLFMRRAPPRYSMVVKEDLFLVPASVPRLV